MTRYWRRAIICVWALIALAMVLSPSPRIWGTYHHTFCSFYEEHRGVIQPMAHFVLMGIFAILVAPAFRKMPMIPAALLVIGAAMIVGVSLELLQLLTPASYARTCDFADLLPCFFGALTGFTFSRVICFNRQFLNRTDVSNSKTN